MGNVAGHSLGGALAEIFAACMDHLGDKAPFKIKAVYTIGAPGVAEQPLVNSQQASKCFNGARIFNEDRSTFDPVPYIAKVGGFVHPQLKAIQLHEDGDDKLSMKEFACTSKEATKGLTGGFTLASLHFADLYLERMLKLLKM